MPDLRASADPAGIKRGEYLAFGPAHYSRNITPDPETGIGRYTDAQLARMLSDEDLGALYEFLHSLAPQDGPTGDPRFEKVGSIPFSRGARPGQDRGEDVAGGQAGQGQIGRRTRGGRSRRDCDGLRGEERRPRTRDESME